jgi:hypothetical protein
MLIDVVSNKNDAMQRPVCLPHLTLNLPAGVDEAAEDRRVDLIDALRAPAFVEVVEKNPDRRLAFEVLGNQVAQLCEVMPIEQS